MNYESILDDLRRWNELFGGGIPTEADIEMAMRGGVDAETKHLMASYCHTLERRMVTHTAASTYPETWSLKDFEDFIAEFITSVPPDKRTSAVVELKGGYDESTELEVRYERPQTDEEWALDVAHALMHARKRQSDDLMVYSRLKQKFG